MEGAPAKLTVEVDALKEDGVMLEAAPPNTVTCVSDPVLADDCVLSLLRGTSFLTVTLAWTVDWHLFLRAFM